MSQRECSGFNAPRFSVCAGHDVVVGPERRTSNSSLDFGPLGGILVVLANVPSLTLGVPQPANAATSFSGRAFVPHFSLVAPFQSRAEHVGHPTSATVLRLLSVLPAGL